MARRKINASQLSHIYESEEPKMTPAERAQRLAMARENVQAMTGAIQENSREDQRMIRIHRKAKSNLFLDMTDLMSGIGALPSSNDVLLPEDRLGMRPQMLTEQFPTAHDNIIMEDLYRKQRVPQTRHPAKPVRQSLRENIAQPTRPAASQQAGWMIKKYIGETRGGNSIPIWKVQNNQTNAAVDKLFRIEEIAARVAAYLNESNNMYDPRVVSLIMNYDKRDRLLKEARALEKTVTNDKPMKMSRLQTIKSEIAALDYKLGL